MNNNMKVTFKACTTAVLLFLLFFPQITQAQEQINLSLEEAIELALENNREIRIAKYGVEAAESGVKEVTGGFLPEISISAQRSEEHTSELQSRGHLVCRLLLEKK